MKLFGVLLVLISLSLGQSVAEDADFLVEFKFVLREERIPAIIGYILTNKVEMHDIKTEDIITLSKLDQYDLDATIELLNYFGITSEKAFTVNNLKYVLEAFGIDFIELYRDLQSDLKLNGATIMQVVEDLSMKQLEFLLATVGTGDVYEVLETGNYDKEHVNKALETAGKTTDEVFITGRNFMHKKVLAMDATKFMTVLVEKFGWNRESSTKLYKALNLTTRDVYEVEKFRTVFVNISESLNEKQSFGIFVKPQKIAVHELVYNRSFNSVDEMTVKIEVNAVEVNSKKTRNLGERIVEVGSKSAGPKYIEIVGNYYNTSEECYYVTKTKGETQIHQVQLDEESFNKTESLQFIVGSPIICDGYLYGLVREEDEDTIKFDNFYTLDNPPPPEHFPSKASLTSSVIISLAFSFFIFVLS